MQLSANRKLIATRWMGSWTVEVYVGRIASPNDSQRKASEGAERSCRVRRRRRGQRRGKRRSRVCQTREPHSSPQRDQVLSPYAMKSHLRACDYWYAKVQSFSQWLKKSSLVYQGAGFFIRPSDRMEYATWKHRWITLSKRIKPFGEMVVWCSRIGPTFAYYLEQQHNVRLVGCEDASKILREILSSIPHYSYVRQGWGAENELLLSPVEECWCRVCRTHTECPSGHGVGATSVRCGVCEWRRHRGTVGPRRGRRRGEPREITHGPSYRRVEGHALCRHCGHRHGIGECPRLNRLRR